jgi:Ca2+-binding RTX toxin-like protein
LQRKAQMLEILGRRRGTGVLALLVSAVALLGAAQAAQAGTLTKSGTSYVYTETDGDTGVNTVNLAECPGCGSGGGNLLGISDDTDSMNVTAVGCSPTGVQPATTFIICDMGANGVTSVVVSLGGGNDSVNGISSGGVPLIVPLTANGNTGNDTLIGGVGNDSLSGDAGDDTLKGVDGADSMSGGDGLGDVVDYGDRSAPLNVSIDGGGVANDGEAGEGDNTGSAIENIIGGSGNDTLLGNAGANTISGNVGNDTIRGGKGTDQLSGGDGIDTIDYQDRTAAEGVSVTLDNVANDGQAGENDNIGATFENVTGGPGNDFLAGNDAVNTIFGLAGNDTIMGRKGTDTLSGGDGAGDVIDYSYLTAGEPAAVSLDGVVNEPEGENIGSAFEGASGGAGNDTLIGNNDANTIRGGGGNDSIDPKGGGDSVFGDAGDDNIESRDGAVDGIDCGAGTDTNNADSGDNRANCELPAAAVPNPAPNPNPNPAPTPIPTPTPTPLKTMAVTVSYGYAPKFPKKTTKFSAFTAKNVPKGSKLVARCVTKKGKKCKGKLGKSSTIKKTTKKTVALKTFNKKYPAGSTLEVIVSKAGYKTQIKIVQVLKNKTPNIVTRCLTPPSTKRRSC